MKFLVVLAVAVASASADVSHIVGSHAEIVRSNKESYPDGSYQHSYETSDGVSVQAQGVVKNPNSEEATLEVHGSVRYVSPDGVPVEFNYVANENGYQPQGNHIPTPRTYVVPESQQGKRI